MVVSALIGRKGVFGGLAPEPPLSIWLRCLGLFGRPLVFGGPLRGSVVVSPLRSGVLVLVALGAWPPSPAFVGCRGVLPARGSSLFFHDFAEVVAKFFPVFSRGCLHPGWLFGFVLPVSYFGLCSELLPCLSLPFCGLSVNGCAAHLPGASVEFFEVECVVVQLGRCECCVHCCCALPGLGV